MVIDRNADCDRCCLYSSLLEPLLQLKAHARGLTRAHADAVTITTNATLACADDAAAGRNAIKAELAAPIRARIQSEGTTGTVGHFDLHLGIGNRVALCIDHATDDLAWRRRCGRLQIICWKDERSREKKKEGEE